MKPRDLIIDSFAGGGGASEGIRAAIGRDPDYALNHDAKALAMHRINHPDTVHIEEDVWNVDAVGLCAGRPIGLLWMSPDCKHFSKAKGGKPREKAIRGLAWVGVRWVKSLPKVQRPRIVFLENVEEFAEWGGLLPDGRPDPLQRGKTFKVFVESWQAMGYVVEHRELRACDVTGLRQVLGQRRVEAVFGLEVREHELSRLMQRRQRSVNGGLDLLERSEDSLVLLKERLDLSTHALTSSRHA